RLLREGWRLVDGEPLTRNYFYPWNMIDPASTAVTLLHDEFRGLSLDIQWRLGPAEIVHGGIAAILADARTIEIRGRRIPVASRADTTLLAALSMVRD